MDSVVDYADTGFSNFAIEYLRENEKVTETFLSVLMGACSNPLSQKIVQILVTLSLLIKLLFFFLSQEPGAQRKHLRSAGGNHALRFISSGNVRTWALRWNK